MRQSEQYIPVVMTFNHNQIRAEPMGGSHGHCRVYAILAGLIICGGHHATRTVIAHHNRMAQECRIVMFFDRYEERIHVYMYYLSLHKCKDWQKFLFMLQL